MVGGYVLVLELTYNFFCFEGDDGGWEEDGECIGGVVIIDFGSGVDGCGYFCNGAGAGATLIFCCFNGGGRGTKEGDGCVKVAAGGCILGDAAIEDFVLEFFCELSVCVGEMVGGGACG